MDELEQLAGELLEFAVVKIDTQHPHQVVVFILDIKGGGAQGAVTAGETVIVGAVIHILGVFSHCPQSHGGGRGVQIPPADRAVNDGHNGAVFAVDVMKGDLVSGAQYQAEELNQLGVLLEHGAVHMLTSFSEKNL